MSVSALLLPELDQEIKVTRTLLERVPMKPDYAPHAKSMPLARLASHIAEMPGFGLTVLTTPELDFSKSTFTPLAFESAAQLMKVLDEGAAKLRSTLAKLPDSAWTEQWRLAFGDKTIFEGERFLAYREMFLNHLVHHRAQLGVYLRLNDVPLPSTYGPTADDRMGF
jgi:uncharacterized damage-inducible protein DinB